MLFLKGTLVTSFAGLCAATSKKNLLHCPSACADAVGNIVFGDSAALDYYLGLCQTQLKLGSIYAAWTVYCTKAEIDVGIERYSGWCEQYGNVTLLPMSDFAANLTQETISEMRVMGQYDFTATDIINTTVLISKDYFKQAFKTEVVWDYEYDHHHYYGYAMYAFWGGVLLIAAINNVLEKFWRRRYRPRIDDSEKVSSRLYQLPAPLASFKSFIQTHLTIPAGLGSYHQRLYYGLTVPTRMESIVVCLYWTISLILCAVNYRAFTGNVYWPNKSQQVWRYISDRAGILSYSNLAMIWMFSGRNNVFQWATGLSFGTFNIFHRHVARVATTLAIVHSVGYTVLEKNYYKTYAEEFKEKWFYLGVVATILMSLLLPFSSILLRRFAYELFLLIHIAASIVIIYALFMHTSIYDGEYNPYLWPLVGIWSFDRLLRLVRLAHCNIHVGFNKKAFRTIKSSVRYNKASNVIRITIQPAAGRLAKPRPGQHYFIYAPLTSFGWRGWENHPFTVGSWNFGDHNNDANTSLTSPTDNVITNKEMKSNDFGLSTASRYSDSMDTAPQQNQTGLVFYVRPFDGFTKRLRDICLHSTGSESAVSLLLEGPYGHTPPLENFETVILIAGGTGLAGVLPHIQEHLRRTPGSARTQDLHLIWSTRSAVFIHDIMSDELCSAVGRSDIHMSLFATKTADGKEGNTSSYSVQYRRPDVSSSIQNIVREAAEALGRVAVLVCGPASMADEARVTVHMVLKAGAKNVEYYEEAYGW